MLDVGHDSGQIVGFIGALRSTGLDRQLKGEGPFTLFAPRDHAWQALPEEVLTDPLLLDQVLRSHIVEQDVRVEEVLSQDSFVTLEGSTIVMDVRSGTPSVNGANLTSMNLPATNGRIHIIDRVLTPPSGSG